MTADPILDVRPASQTRKWRYRRISHEAVGGRVALGASAVLGEQEPKEREKIDGQRGRECEKRVSASLICRMLRKREECETAGEF